MKDNYFDNDMPKKKAKSKRKKKKGKMSAGKWIVLIISLIVAALASFLITIKILVPDYDLTSLLPEKAQSFVSENILGHTTTTEPTTAESTTKPKPTVKTLDYLEDEEFKLEYSKQGNYIGNLLNGGKVGNDGSYIYHIVDGKGIYRFAPGSENYSCIYKSEDILSSINLRGDYIYFVDETIGKLQKLQKGSKTPKTIADNARFVFVYNSLVYYITKDNSLCVMDAKELIPATLYNSADSEMQLVGISKQRVFFSLRDGDTLEFLTIDNGAKTEACRFREDATDKFETGFVMENGFLYYIRRDTESGNGHYIVRQKFGSQKTFDLVKTSTNLGYPIVDKNRLFYADYEDNKMVMKELNMNNEKKKAMVKSDALGNEGITQDISFFHGGEYDFIIGKGNYKASSNLTSSTNVMTFKDGKWNY
jgi:hypothetical protein